MDYGKKMSEPAQLAQRSTNQQGSRVIGYLRRHPILCLMLLSPGIPEYLSGSSSFAILTLNPILFLLFVGLNVGLYGPGVLLIREAMVRWRKGWATVFLLGFAYAIVEEGLDLSTFFNPKAGPVGVLGVYGHWLGVNWVWTVGLMLFHSAISIALPILLFRLAFPALKSQSLLSGPRTFASFFILFLDSILLFSIVAYWAGPVITLSSFLAVLAFIIAARKIPAGFLSTNSSKTIRNPRAFWLLGILFFPAAILIGGISAGVNAPPLLPIILEALLSFLILRTVLRSLGTTENSAQKTALAVGLATPVMVFGLVASIATGPLIIAADAAFSLFLRRLWRNSTVHPLAILNSGLPPMSPDLPITGSQKE